MCYYVSAKTKVKNYGFAAAICMIAYVVLNIVIDFITYFAVGASSYGAAKFITQALFVFAAIALFMKKDKLTIIAISAEFIVSIFSRVRGFSPYIFLEIAYYLSVIFLLICVFTELLPDLKETAQRLFYIPIALNAFLFIITIIIKLKNMHSGTSLISLIGNLLSDIVLLLIAVFISLLIKYPNGKEKIITISKSENTTVTGAAAANTSESDLFISLASHILLILFTLGIYNLIWIYKTTERLSAAKPSKARGAVKELLLCMFIPFYSIFWTYKTAQIVDEFARDRNVKSDIATLSLVLAIFLPIIPPIIIQDKINNIVTSEGNGNIAENTTTAASPIGMADEIKKYKDLLDSGAITQEEYENKKKELL